MEHTGSWRNHYKACLPMQDKQKNSIHRGWLSKACPFPHHGKRSQELGPPPPNCSISAPFRAMKKTLFSLWIFPLPGL